MRGDFKELLNAVINERSCFTFSSIVRGILSNGRTRTTSDVPYLVQDVARNSVGKLSSKNVTLAGFSKFRL